MSEADRALISFRWAPNVSFCRLLNHVYVRSESSEKFIKLNEAASGIWGYLEEWKTAFDIIGLTGSHHRYTGTVDAQGVEEFLIGLTHIGILSCSIKQVLQEENIDTIGLSYKNYLDHLARKHTIPLTAFIEVTYSCNEVCIHCAIPNHRPGSMSRIDYGVLLEELRDIGTLSLIFSGGEPFSRNDFMEIVSLSRRMGFSVRIYTNATIMDDEKLDALRAMHVMDYDVSIYGATANVHDFVTQVSGSFERTLDNVRRMVQRGMRVYLKCPVMNCNVREIPRIKEIADDLGIRVGFFPRITAKNDGNKDPHRLRISAENYREFLQHDFIYEQAMARRNIIGEPRELACEDLNNMCSIDPWGNVRLCNQLDMVGGNINEKPFKEIWAESDIFKLLRSMKTSSCIACSECQIQESCDRCPGLALLEDGDLFACSSTAKWETESLNNNLSEAIEAKRAIGACIP